MSVHQQLQSGEEMLFQARISKIALLPQIALAVLACTACFTFLYLSKTWAGWIAGLAIGLLGGGILLVKVIVLRSHEYVLTNKRIIRQTGIVAKNSIDTQLDKINNVEHRQSVWGRLLSYGDVEIDTASEHGCTRFAFISRPLAFKNAVLGAREHYRTGLAPGVTVQATPLSGAERLRQLKKLLDEGLISEAEFQDRRKVLLAEL
jgi:uncharacterized membrane protein YdbT with pleckstrin-like domain